MRAEYKITGGYVGLRQIEIEDCSPTYAAWLNDKEVNCFLETKWSLQSIETIKGFVKSQIDSPDSVLFAIILTESNKHIGNIKIGPVHPHYKRADISYFIGEKGYWGKGAASEAVRLACGYGFRELCLHRIEAGTYCIAYGSQKVLEKNGFKREGVLKEHVYYNGMWIDAYRYGLISGDFQKG